MIKEYINTINKHYDKTIDKYGYNIKGLGWRKGRLSKRYKIISESYNFKNKSVLDYGCGFCNFYEYIKKKNIKIKEYSGVEINPKIRKYISRRYKEKITIYENTPKIKYDIIVSNGVHNYKTKNCEKIFYNDINKLLKITKKALIISFINNNVDYKDNYLSYKNLFKTIKFIQKKNYNFIINQTMNKYETFMVILK